MLRGALFRGRLSRAFTRRYVVSFPWMPSCRVATMIRTIAIAESPKRACCCAPRGTSILICRVASWWAIAGATSRRAAVPDAGPFSSTEAMPRPLRLGMTIGWLTGGSCGDRVGGRGNDGRGSLVMKTLDQLKIRIFADGADRASMLALCAKPYISGLTTNPTLMRKAGVVSYREFAREILEKIREKPVCFEVLADDFAEMERQALEIASWGDNVYVKVPITNTRGDSSRALVSRLVSRNVKVNVTALTTLAQVRGIVAELNPAVASYVSIFADQIMDTGMDPLHVIAKA